MRGPALSALLFRRPLTLLRRIQHMSIPGSTGLVLLPRLRDADEGHSLIGTGNLDKAAIFSAAGDSTWAASADFHVRCTNTVAGEDRGYPMRFWGRGTVLTCACRSSPRS
jgi:hypothetical protein